MLVAVGMTNLLQQQPGSRTTHLLAGLRKCRQGDLAVPCGSVVVVTDETDVLGYPWAAIGKKRLDDAQRDEIGGRNEAVRALRRVKRRDLASRFPPVGDLNVRRL